MKRWLAGTALVLGLLGGLLAPAAADPPAPEAIPVTCDGTTYSIVTNRGQSLWTPAFVTTSNVVLVPISIDLTFTDVTTGESEHVSDVKGAGVNPNAVSCTVDFTTTDPESGHVFTIKGSFTALVTPVGTTTTSTSTTTTSTTTTTLPQPSADLSVTKVAVDTDDPTPGIQPDGDTFQYHITVHNDGPSRTRVSVRDTLPTDVTYVSSSFPIGYACALHPGGVVICATASSLTVAPGADVVFVITVVTNDAGDSFTNNVTVTGEQPDPDLSDNDFTLTTSTTSP